ncbi:MAG: DHA2 family efflux MFS transporter permease subunit [Simkaniaceae bacterium]
MKEIEPFRGGLLALLTLALSLCTFMQVLDTSIANVSIPYIAGGLAVSNNDGTWVITCFAVGNAIALPLTGWLAERFGSVKVMVLSTLLFTFTSWMCGGAFTFNMLIIMRFIQGLVAGPLIPLSQSLLLQNYPPKKRNIALTIWSMIVVVAPVIGPIIGGWITYNYSWPWIFYINIPVGITSAFLIWHLLKGRESVVKKRPIDYLGLILLTLAVSALQILLDQGQQLDWFRNPIIKTLGVVSALSFIYLFIWELFHKDPLIDFRLLKNRNYAIGTFVTAVSYMVLFGTIVVSPLWLQDYQNYTATWAGLAISTMGIVPIFASYPVAKMMNSMSLKPIIMTSFIAYALALFYFTSFTTNVSFAEVAMSRLLLGVGISFYLPPLISISMAHMPNEKLSSATGIYHFFRIFAGGAGTSLFVTLWERRTSFHHSNLVSFLTPYYGAAKNRMQMLLDRGFSKEESYALLNDITDQQAAMLGVNDTFWVSGWIFITLIIFVFFFKKRERFSKGELSSDG